eukprot:5150257-Amphidinium_carterae.1
MLAHILNHYVVQGGCLSRKHGGEDGTFGIEALMIWVPTKSNYSLTNHMPVTHSYDAPYNTPKEPPRET